MRESKFQLELTKKLKRLFPECMILKNNPDHIQGIPDLLILYQDRWAALEVKESKDASSQPNQDYYVKVMNDMSIAAFIYPENEEEVLNELQLAFGSARNSRLSKSK